MIDIKDIFWVAGLLEGEGCFYARRRKTAVGNECLSPSIQLMMTDLDIVIRVAKILGAYRVAYRQNGKFADNKPHYKQQYRMHLGGAQALGWMMTLLPLMGSRRQEKIIELIGIAKNRSVGSRNHGPSKLPSKNTVWLNPAYQGG